MKKIVFITTCLFIIVFSMTVHAIDFEMNETDQWSIELANSSNQQASIKLKNKGKKIYTVVAKVMTSNHTQEQKISKKSVSSDEILIFDDIKTGRDREQIEVIVSWREKLITSRHGKIASGQKHQEVFVIAP
ncbi:hypothetical protein JOC86_002102 [Bacillus pakistanensis]|uniref:Uncharacterized protein n=1 Tax=Rossellomorea pakistanensis TaxID=992288 RepID=A0ABS2NCG5_9BACI|nr:hypothetical protein [Bacillus pakistanensis]MBM7585560.1 hypothetical protein [Bacillus pakistanensis]